MPDPTIIYAIWALNMPVISNASFDYLIDCMITCYHNLLLAPSEFF